MSRRVVIEVLRVAADPRGWVAEPLDPADFPGQANAHLVVSAPGAIRGNHHHPRGSEVLTVAGPALVRTRADGKSIDTEVPAGSVYRFRIPPGVAHAVKNTGAVPGILIGFNTVAHDPAAPDTVPDRILD